jgi:hypothetical protein
VENNREAQHATMFNLLERSSFAILLIFLTINQPYASSPEGFPLKWGIISIGAFLRILFWSLAQ